MTLGGSRAGLVDEPLAVYRIHHASLSANRPRSIRGVAIVLERAATQPSLTEDELRFLKGELAALRADAGVAEAEEAVRGLAPHPRRRCLKVAFGRERYTVASRLSALAAVIAP